RTRMMGIGAEDDRLALSGPRSLEIGNGILCARGRGCGAEKHQCVDETPHRLSPALIRTFGECGFKSSWRQLCAGAPHCEHGSPSKSLTMPGYSPRTFGMWMNSQGDGIGPTGTSITVGPSRRAKPRRKAARSAAGSLARSASAPKLSAKRTKSGL